MKLTRATVATVLFLVLLIGTYAIHITFVRVNVVFYAAVADGLIAATAAGVVLFTANFFKCFSYFERFQLLVIWLLAGYAIAITIPTVIDRSLSIYILEKLQQRGGGIRLDSFERVFTEEYAREHRLVDVRLTEQIESGTVIIENGCVRLTSKGETVANFGRYFRSHWLPKARLLMGDYTDALTDPFRHSAEHLDYKC